MCSPDSYATAIVSIAPLCGSPLQLHLVRDVTGEQFTEAINKSLLPRMQLAGACGRTGGVGWKGFSGRQVLVE